MLEGGKGTAADAAGALGWYRKAADQGYPSAEFVVGGFYLKGVAVKQDTDEAVRWLKRAAEHGQTDAGASLSTLYANGNGVKKDMAEAAKWARVSADLGNPAAAHARNSVPERDGSKREQ